MAVGNGCPKFLLNDPISRISAKIEYNTLFFVGEMPYRYVSV